jgi:hypothetical protein
MERRARNGAPLFLCLRYGMPPPDPTFVAPAGRMGFHLMERLTAQRLLSCCALYGGDHGEEASRFSQREFAMKTPETSSPSKTTTVPRDDRDIITRMDAVEIKVTVRPDQELRAERELEVDEDTADVRLIYFYDTPNLDLLKAGVVLRARLVKGDDDDSTVKVRPTKMGDLREIQRRSEGWRGQLGFKLEADWVGDRQVCSVSLTHRQQRDEIDDVANGKRAIHKLFSKDQERFLGAFYEEPVDFEKLVVMGPIRVLRWKLKHKHFPHEMTVEEWRLPDGDDLVEVSIKAPPSEAREAQAAFDNHLREHGLDPQGAQETKTRTALKYFADVRRKALRPG